MAELNLRNLLESAEKKVVAEEKELQEKKYELLYESEFFRLFINQRKRIKVEKKNEPNSERNKTKRAELELENESLKREIQEWSCNDEEATKKKLFTNNFIIAESSKEWRYAGMTFRNLQTEEDIVEVISKAMKVKWYQSLAYNCGIMATINGRESIREVNENIIPSLEKRFNPIVWDFDWDTEERYLDVLDTDFAQLTE